MKRVWMIALESGQYLGADGYATTSTSHAQQFTQRKDAKAEYAKLLGWRRAIIVSVLVSDAQDNQQEAR